MATVLDRKITQNESNNMAGPLELDLIALFKTLEEATLDTDTNQSPEQFIKDIEKLFGGKK